MGPGFEVEHSLGILERGAFWVKLREHSFKTGFNVKVPRYREVHDVPLAQLSKHSRQSAWFRELVSKVETVAGHEGGALVIRNMIGVPKMRSWERKQIRERPLDHPIAKRASRAVRYTLGAAGLLPLVDRYTATGPRYFNSAIGKEWPYDHYHKSKCKLPKSASTLYPSRPFGVGLFGPSIGGGLDLISPDVVAFIALDIHKRVHRCGPVLYGINRIKEGLDEIDSVLIEQLQRNSYRVEPDQGLTMSHNQDYGFGGVTKINLLGMRKDKYPYMRFIQEHTREINGQEYQIRNLEKVLDAIKEETEGYGIDLRSGDVLLINNRRTATQWVKKSDFHSILGHVERHELERYDRTILRMMFYLKEPLPGVED